MTTSLDHVFLDCSERRLRQLAGRIEDCLSRLDDGRIWLRSHDHENAIGNLVLHLCGNLRQWIVSGVGGEPDIRQRDQEFTARDGLSGAELSARLAATVSDAVSVIARCTPERLLEPVVIQGYTVTVMEAIYHVVEHFAGHTGQVIFATKALTGADLGYYRHLNAPQAHGEKTP